MIDVFSNEAFQAFLGVNVILALGLYVMVVTGQLSLGQAGFMGVGAYAASWLNVDQHWPVEATLAAGALAGAAVAVPVAVGANRVRGIYLIVGTLAVGEIIQTGLRNFDAVGGVQGYFGMAPIGPHTIFLSCLGVLAVLAVLIATPVGLAMRSVRDDEDAAAALGVPVRMVKIGAVVFGAAVTGLAGALYAHYLTFINPENFGVESSFSIALYVLIGGTDTLIGPIVGAFLLTYLPQAFKVFSEYEGVVFGGFLVAVMIVTHRGLISRGLVLFVRRQFEGLAARRRSAAARASPPTSRPPAARVRTAGDEGRSSQQPVLALSQIEKQFAGVTALRSVDLEIFPSEVLGVIGPNGAGKSTLINVATGHYRPTAGSIVLRGRDITRLRADRRARLGIGRTFQAVRLFDHLTVAENVRLASRHGRETAEWLELDRLERLLPRELSYADQRKLQIAQALALGSRVLFLDEPSIGMSAPDLAELGRIIGAAGDAGTAVVLVDHNLDLVMELADRIAVLDFGLKIADDQPAAIVADAGVQAAYLGDAALTATAT